jgi:translation initiation factor 1 (eIF-1/SUI1)
MKKVNMKEARKVITNFAGCDLYYWDNEDPEQEIEIKELMNELKKHKDGSYTIRKDEDCSITIPRNVQILNIERINHKMYLNFMINLK